MPDYILREAALKEMLDKSSKHGFELQQQGKHMTRNEGEMFRCDYDVIKSLPAADVVEVVRCKDCDRRIHSADLTSTVLCPWFGEHHMDKMSFCSDGISSKIRAKWNEISYPDEDNGVPCTMDFFVCSNCGKKVFFNFEKTEKCPKCHAIMDGGEHHAD